MQKKFVSSLLLLLFLNILIKPVWIFGIDLTVQNRVGATEYGLYSAIFSFTFIFNILLDLGLTHYNNRAIARNPIEIARNFSQLTSLKVFLGILYLLVAIGLGLALDYTSRAFTLLLILAGSQFLASFVLFLRSHLAGLHLFKTDSLMSVLDKVLMIMLCGALLFGSVLESPFTVIHFALAQLCSYLLVAVLAFFMVLKKARVFVWKLDLKKYRADLKKSFPYALLILLMALYTRVDSVMLEQISGAFENGIYAQAFRLLDAVNQVGYLFAVLLLPIFSGMFGRSEDVKQLARLSFTLIFVVMLAVALSGFFWAGPLMNRLYVAHSELSTPVFKLLILSSIAFGCTYVFGTLLTARGDLKTLNTVAVSGFVLNVVLNLILIPDYGAVGAAVATVFTQFITAIVQLIYSFRLAQIRFESGYWGRLLLFTLAALALSWSLQQLVLTWPLLLVLNFGGVLMISLAFRLFNLRAAIDLVRHRFR